MTDPEPCTESKPDCVPCAHAHYVFFGLVGLIVLVGLFFELRRRWHVRQYRLRRERDSLRARVHDLT